MRFIQNEGASSDKYEFFNMHVSVKHVKTQFSYSKELQNVIGTPKLPLIVNLKTNDVAYVTKKLKKLNSMFLGEERTYLYYSILKDLLWLACLKICCKIMR